jgi:integrase/recombinase XerD
MTDSENRDERIVAVFVERQYHQKADNTAKGRKSHVQHFQRWLSERDISITDAERFDIEDHFDELRQGHPDKYALDRLDAINAFYTWLQEGGKERLDQRHDITINRDDNPTKGILASYEDIDYRSKKSRIYKHDIVAITRDEAEKLVAPENVPDPQTRNRLLLKMFLQTGVRSSEIREVRLGDINREDRRIRVRDQKNDRRRTVFYQPSLDPLLKRWLDDGLRDTYGTATKSDYLFLTYKKSQITSNAIREIVDKAAQNADIQDKMYEDAAGHPRKKVTPHTLRHTYARFAVTGDNKVDISRLARLMGHRDKNGNPNITTTKKYLDFREEDLREASQACIPDI